MPDKKNYFEDELPPDADKDPLEDTRPTGLFPTVKPSGGNRLVGLLLILGAVGFTIATVMILLNPPSQATVVTSATNTPPQIAQNTQETEATQSIPTTAPQTVTTANNNQPLPTIDATIAQQLLSAPIERVANDMGGVVERNLLEPFTIIPARPRNEVIQYTVSQGDTIETIAARFGLQPETIAWSNPRKIIQVLRQGDIVTIPPADGVYIKTIGSATIADMVRQYKLTDPYVVLDSPYNRVVVQEQALTPESAPRNGTPLFFPGGEAEQIVWQVAVEIIQGEPTGGSGTGNASAPPPPPRVVFQNGEQGSCPPQEIVGGAYWVNPLSGGYVITRGYTSWHPGIDLATPVGTPVKAANSGRVIFSGWNSFGYGYMVALVHGPTITIYAHLSEYYTNCGQDVVAGQVIGASGNTGNSSGPHLHFEIRGTNNNATQDLSERCLSCRIKKITLKTNRPICWMIPSLI
ncbi:MAG: peptidoglycan DD-metalloendopeptidase family protein [Anaerolineae bacterium]|nr:peptidoglycan DD-metalloendopeptidase family protein [Anaerolineae bacterium]